VCVWLVGREGWGGVGADYKRFAAYVCRNEDVCHPVLHTVGLRVTVTTVWGWKGRTVRFACSFRGLDSLLLPYFLNAASARYRAATAATDRLFLLLLPPSLHTISHSFCPCRVRRFRVITRVVVRCVLNRSATTRPSAAGK